MYSGGVLSSSCGTNRDSSYIQTSRGGNACDIHSKASYPAVSATLSAPGASKALKAKYGMVYAEDVEEHRATYDANMRQE